MNVFEAALSRIEQCYLSYDQVVVSFSGGKDSTVVLELAVKVARELGKLPVKVFFCDEEAIFPDTVDYVTRTANRGDLDFDWVCLPVEHRNGCSRTSMFWIPWEESKQDIWVRPIPSGAITLNDLDELRRSLLPCPYPSLIPILYAPEKGSVCVLRGIRMQESLRRRGSIKNNKNSHLDNWLAINSNFAFDFGKETYDKTFSHITQTNPIFDFTINDVWLTHKVLECDYNRIYDKLYKAGVATSLQRVCQPFGEEPLQNLPHWRILYPQSYDRIAARVPGVATAKLYNKSLYVSKLNKKIDYRELLLMELDKYPKVYRYQIMEGLIKALNWHKNKTARELHNHIADPITNLSWYYLFKLALRGDLKGRGFHSIKTQISTIVDRLGIRFKIAKAMDDAQLTDIYLKYLASIGEQLD
jgi:predicted phosphoadenosine phosphosulfate sulfurtransferase